MNVYLEAFLRSVILFAEILALAKLLGKRQMAELTYFDYITGITIGAIAGSASVNEHVHIGSGIISLLVWTFIPFILSIINTKNLSIKRFIGGKPLVIIENGSVKCKNMLKARYTIEDLLMQLREKDVFDLSEVEFAILEVNGKLNVLKKSLFNSVTPKDLNISTTYKGIMTDLIINGRVIESNLRLANKDTNWLIDELSKKNVISINNVVLASLTSDGKLQIITKN